MTNEEKTMAKVFLYMGIFVAVKVGIAFSIRSLAKKLEEQ